MSTFAVVFPGQGSQKLGMLADLAPVFPVVEATFTEASKALGYDLWHIVQQDEAKLNQTEYTQPAILTASVAIWRIWQQHNQAKPQYLAGHSLGEYTALTCAEAISFADAVRLVAERGRLMQSAVPAGVGAMAAILGLSDEQVKQACAESAENEVVAAVNFNSPGQVVIAGNKAAVERAMEKAKAMGAKRALPLPVSVPSHCALMKGAAEKLADILANMNITKPKIQVVHNVDVLTHDNAAQIREALIKQLYSPVRWSETVQSLFAKGCTQFIECGPGKVLTGLNKRIVEAAECSAVGDLASLQSLKEGA
jgi:[acyl-carrier-protein] S-malonyltransferase